MKIEADVSGLAAMIDKRFSVRKYEKAEVPGDKMDAIRAYVEELNRSFQRMRIHVCDDSSGFMNPILMPFIKEVRHSFVMEGVKTDDLKYKAEIGIAGELLVLRATSLGLGTVWVGGDKMFFSQEKAKKAINSENPCPVVIPFGPHSAKFSAHKEKADSEMTRDWRGSAMLLAAMKRAPSALNRMPWVLSGDDQEVRVSPADPAAAAGKSSFVWIDCGIATAHAIAFTGARTVEVQSDAIVVTK